MQELGLAAVQSGPAWALFSWPGDDGSPALAAKVSGAAFAHTVLDSLDVEVTGKSVNEGSPRGLMDYFAGKPPRRADQSPVAVPLRGRPGPGRAQAAASPRSRRPSGNSSAEEVGAPGEARDAGQAEGRTRAGVVRLVHGFWHRPRREERHDGRPLPHGRRRPRPLTLLPEGRGGLRDHRCRAPARRDGLRPRRGPGRMELQRGQAGGARRGCRQRSHEGRRPRQSPHRPPHRRRLPDFSRSKETRSTTGSSATCSRTPTRS